MTYRKKKLTKNSQNMTENNNFADVDINWEYDDDVIYIFWGLLR